MRSHWCKIWTYPISDCLLNGSEPNLRPLCCKAEELPLSVRRDFLAVDLSRNDPAEFGRDDGGLADSNTNNGRMVDLRVVLGLKVALVLRISISIVGAMR